jgi:toxin ParE1/3/4
MSASNLTTYRLTPAARNDLENIWLYTVQTWSIRQADRYTDILEDTFERLVSTAE